ncbi:hypothetical protein TNCV_3833381 [Trichonephila clavipes]|nr:hypothetical protein TNCV_3833381 [Trichonephila clavipes]
MVQNYEIRRQTDGQAEQCDVNTHSMSSLSREQSEILTINRIYKIIENHVASVGAPCDDPSWTPIARLAPMIFTSTIPGGFYDEY